MAFCLLPRNKVTEWSVVSNSGQKNYPRGMEEWINKNGKLVCSLCGTSIERGMPFKGQKLTFYRGWYVVDEMHDIRNGYDRCRCTQSESIGRVAEMRREILEEARLKYEADSWKRRVMTILFVALAIGVFLFFDFS
jgi:hypothetical protein